MTDRGEKIDIGFEHFVLKARNEHEQIFFYIHNEFVPNLKAAAVTPKFYARHDNNEGELPDPTFIKAIELALIKGPKERSSEPETENQRYGWDVEPLIATDRSDQLLYHCRTNTQITKVADEIFMSTRNVPKEPPFTGIPFKL